MPITAVVCVSAIAVRAASAARRIRRRGFSPASSSEAKLIVYSPALPRASASASFSASTMSRALPRAGLGSDE